jgi:hypothetical protein
MRQRGRPDPAIDPGEPAAMQLVDVGSALIEQPAALGPAVDAMQTHRPHRADRKPRQAFPRTLRKVRDCRARPLGLATGTFSGHASVRYGSDETLALAREMDTSAVINTKTHRLGRRGQGAVRRCPRCSLPPFRQCLQSGTRCARETRAPCLSSSCHPLVRAGHSRERSDATFESWYLNPRSVIIHQTTQRVNPASGSNNASMKSKLSVYPRRSLSRMRTGSSCHAGLFGQAGQVVLAPSEVRRT